MINTKVILYLFIPFFFSLGCTKKAIKLEVKQDGCNNFKIDGASYVVQKDPCDSVNTSVVLDISFTFKGDSACLYLIAINPVLFDQSNTEMNNVSFQRELKKPAFTISGNDVLFTYTLNFPNLTEAQNFNYMILTFHTENVLEDKSKDAKMRVSTSCSVVTKDMYTVNTDTIFKIPSSVSTFQINLWDNAAEDGDRVSVYLNGTWIIDNHSLLNEPTNFDISTALLKSGSNDLVVFALNQGTVGPNTASIGINNHEVKNFSPGLETGEALRIEF